MSFTVSGYIEGVAYDVTVNPAADAGEGEPVTTGSPNALALLDRHAGEMVSVTPTGPSYTVDPASRSGEAILGALMALTEVRQTSGDVPQVIPPHILGAIY